MPAQQPTTHLHCTTKLTRTCMRLTADRSTLRCKARRKLFQQQDRLSRLVGQRFGIVGLFVFGNWSILCDIGVGSFFLSAHRRGQRPHHSGTAKHPKPHREGAEETIPSLPWGGRGANQEQFHHDRGRVDRGCK